MEKDTLFSKLKKIFNRFMDILKKPAMSVLPGQLAYYFLMSFIPIIAIVVLITSKIITDYNLISVINMHVPAALSGILSSTVASASNYGNVFLLFVFYIVLASNGPFTIIRMSNTLYGIKDPSFVQSRIKALIMTILLVVLLLFTIIIPIFGGTIVKLVLGYFNLMDKFTFYIPIYQFLKLIISFVFIYFIMRIIYTMSPDRKIKGKTTRWGVLFTTITWIVATEIYSLYVTYLADYDLLYGNFANILILLLWVYILAYLFVMGMAINCNHYKKPDTITDTTLV